MCPLQRTIYVNHMRPPPSAKVRHKHILNSMFMCVVLLFGSPGYKALLLDFCLAGTQLTLGSAMYSRTLLDFDESFQLDCLLKVQSAYTCWVSRF